MRDIERPRERIVWEAWERQAFAGGALAALGLRLVYRGVPSDAGGPDYQDVVLESVHGDLISGDAELHVRTSDWYRHGHHRDGRYNGVVLHVVWTDDVGVTERFDGQLVPTVEIGSGEVLSVWRTTGEEPGLIPHPCISAFAGLTTEGLRERLRLLGMQRMHERADVFAAEMEEETPDQILYRGLLEGLGYASNREGLRELAHVAPYGWLMSLPDGSVAEALLDAASLGPPSPVPVPARLSPEQWRLSRIRPTNHPALRLRGLALVLQRTRPSIAEHLAAAVAVSRRASELRGELTSRDGSGTLIGAGRADELMVSVVLPFARAHDPAGPAAERFASYPSAPSNRWTRAMQAMFGEAGHSIRPGSAAEHQGIHHLYHRHCRYERREGCPVCGASSGMGKRSHGRAL